MRKIPCFRFDLAGFPERDRFEIFRSATGITHEVSQPRGLKPGFSATAEIWNLGNIVINRSRFDGCSFERSAHRLAVDGIDHYTVLFMIKGACDGDLGTGEVAVKEGQVFLLDMARPVSFQVSTTENVFISIPRDLLDQVVPSQNLHGRILDGGSGALLAGFLRLLSEHTGDLTPHEAVFTERATTDLLAACLDPSLDRAHMSGPAVEASLLQNARRFIERNLRDVNLTPALICRAVGLSRSTLYRLFEPIGGVASYVQSRRLTQVCNALVNPLETRSIAEIASHWCFSNPEHFSRVFRRVYGRTPSEFRHELGSVNVDATQVDYHSWLKGDTRSI